MRTIAQMSFISLSIVTLGLAAPPPARASVDDVGTVAQASSAPATTALSTAQGGESVAYSIQCGSVGWWYQTPWAAPWYDGANCYVTNLPHGSQGFIWSNNWYVQPGPGNSCSIGVYDGANCYIGSPPAGTAAFVWGGNIYYTPLVIEAIPTNAELTCVDNGTAAEMLADCVQTGNDFANVYFNGIWWGMAHYLAIFNTVCPAGTSPVEHSQFYVPGSCNPRPDIPPICGTTRSNYEFKLGVRCQ